MKISNAAIIAIALSLPPAAVLAGGSKGGKNGSKNSKASKTGAKAYRYGSYRYSNSMSMSTGDRGVDPNSPTTRPTQTPQPDGGQREVVDQPTPRPTPAPTDRNVVVTPPADSPTTKSPTTPVIPDAPPTTASPMAVITPSPAGVTPSPPPTGATCLLSGFECQLNVSCQGVEACTGTPVNLIDTNGACNGERACYNDGNTVAYCSCNGDRSCIENGGTINNCAWCVQFRFRHCFVSSAASILVRTILISFLFVLQQR